MSFLVQEKLWKSFDNGSITLGTPVGVTGVYQLVEAYQQLTGTAGANQIKDPKIALVQNIGGTGATVVSHILTREA